MEQPNAYLARIQRLVVYKRGERRAVHKPLLLLLAIARHLEGKTQLSFTDLEKPLSALLFEYGPFTKSGPQPELPYWYLQNDGLWELSPETEWEYQRVKKRPTLESLRLSTGHLNPGFQQALQRDRDFAELVVQIILDRYFPPSIHEELIQDVGLVIPEPSQVAEPQWEVTRRRKRHSQFSRDVLRAYDQTCALTGFSAKLAGHHFGCEAAHIQAHCWSGPDLVANGIALSPTVHKLFDRGAWTLDDDRRVLISDHLAGTGPTIEKLFSMRGRALRAPTASFPKPSLEYIRWHREANLGGVYKGEYRTR